MAQKKKKSTGFAPAPQAPAGIEWRQWGDEAFGEARAEGKPVMLVISAVWCHWCHVMDETTFSDSGVAALVNRDFIPVRADSDRRPDLNARYNQSGWPAVSFLTDEGEIIGGASFTYLPPDEFTRLLTDVAEYYRTGAEEIRAAVERIREARTQEAPLPAEPGPGVIADVLQLIGQVYDEDFGGFGGQTKFPYPGVLQYLLTTLADGYIEKIDVMLRKTLDAMAAGGMYDRLDGGFFRYATSRDWSQPHYEKLLADNGALLGAYARALMVIGEESYGRVALDVKRYLVDTMLNRDTRTFAGSQNADEEYYTLDAEGRAARQAPYVDHTIYCGANAAAASGLLALWQAAGDGEARSLALDCLEYLWENLWSGEKGLHHYFDGEPRLAGQLSDSARMLASCIDAYECGGGEGWQDRAIELAAWMLDRLEDKEAGGFYDSGAAPAGAGYAAERGKPLADNSIAADALIRLAQATGQARFGDAARRTLAVFGRVYEERGVAGAEYAQAVQRQLDAPVRVTVVGPPAEPATLEMIRAAHLARIPFRSLEVLDPALHGEDLEEVGYGYAGKPMAYICIGASCQPAVADAALLPERLEKGRSQIS